MVNQELKTEILEGIPQSIPELRPLAPEVNHAPPRRHTLTKDERFLALKNALRYFPKGQHEALAPEFAAELAQCGHIYMYRYRPKLEIKARHLNEFPHRSKQAAAIMLMLCNNLDHAVAQHPDELVTYGGNGAVFQNWAQYRLTMKYLAELEEDQTLVLYSGHPLGVFPSHKDAPRVVVTNGMVIPNYSRPQDLDNFNALGVSQYGQMTAGSFMYIGPQGIVHGTTITILNAGRIHCGGATDLRGKLFVTSGLGGMSGAQGKAGIIAGAVTVIAEVNRKALEKRHSQGWVDEAYADLDKLLARIEDARAKREATAIAYHGNIVDLWERLDTAGVSVELGSDQTSLHNPYGGGYYPAGMSFEAAGDLMKRDPVAFKKAVQESLVRQVKAINSLAARGMYFWDYGNAFLLEAARAGAEVGSEREGFRYPSYVEDIMGPLCFDYGFGPFRWVCASCRAEDLDKTDAIAIAVLEELSRQASPDIKQQVNDNLDWIKAAKANKLVVGSQARILYSNAEGRIKLARAFNEAVRTGAVSAPIVLGRDHHDVSGTDSPYRETANIRDGSKFTADMAVQNVIGCSFRGATWVSLHNGGGVGWGEVINGGFGMLLDGTADADRRLEMMLAWDVNNGVARRSWARNPGAIAAIEREMQREPKLKVTIPVIADDEMLKKYLQG